MPATEHRDAAGRVDYETWQAEARAAYEAAAALSAAADRLPPESPFRAEMIERAGQLETFANLRGYPRHQYIGDLALPEEILNAFRRAQVFRVGAVRQLADSGDLVKLEGIGPRRAAKVQAALDRIPTDQAR